MCSNFCLYRLIVQKIIYVVPAVYACCSSHELLLPAYRHCGRVRACHARIVRDDGLSPYYTTASDRTRVCVVVILTGLVPPRLVVRPVPLFVRPSRHPSRLSHLPPKYSWSFSLSRNFFRTKPTQQFKEQIKNREMNRNKSRRNSSGIVGKKEWE